MLWERTESEWVVCSEDNTMCSRVRGIVNGIEGGTSDELR